jgi:hypothetical protein
MENRWENRWKSERELLEKPLGNRWETVGKPLGSHWQN